MGPILPQYMCITPVSLGLTQLVHVYDVKYAHLFHVNLCVRCRPSDRKCQVFQKCNQQGGNVGTYAESGTMYIVCRNLYRIQHLQVPAGTAVEFLYFVAIS